jgi:hypothetical protein
MVPHVSLMSYTFLLSTPFDPHPTIIMTTNPASRKTTHLQSNPNVCLLVHDWVSHRPPTRGPDPAGTRDGSPPPEATGSSLATLLLNLNTSALSNISTTITGTARFLESGSDEEAWCKEQHLENNTFITSPGDDDGSTLFSQGRRTSSLPDCPTIDCDSRVVVVRVQEGRIADWKGGVRDWMLIEGEGITHDTMPNGAGPSQSGTMVEQMRYFSLGTASEDH